MKRRDFLKTTAAVAGAAAFAAPFVARGQGLETVNVGHLVGICMSPLVLRQGHGYLQRRGPQRPAEVHAQPGRCADRAQQRRHGHHPQPVHQRLRRGGARRAGPHHRRQRRGRAVPDRAEGNRHQEHGRSRGRQGQGPEDRHHPLQHLRAHALSRAGEGRRRLQRLQHRLVQRHAVDGGRVRGRRPRSRDPRRAVRDPADRSARRRAARQQPRRLGSARAGLRHQHHGALPREQAGRDAALPQGAPARRRRHQGRHAEGGRGARRGQVLPRRQGHA